MREVNARRPPPKEFVGKVKRSVAFWERRFCTHPKAEPYSYLAQRAGKRDLGMLAERLWSKVLAEELGAGRERGGPSARRPLQGLCPSGWRLGAVTRAGWGTGEPRARCKAAPRACGPAPGESPPPSWRPAYWAHESSSPPPPASPARAPLRLRWFPTSPLSHPGLWVGRWHCEAESQTPGRGGRGSGGARPGASLARADPGEPSPRREARALGYRESATPPPRVPLSPRRTPGSGNPRLLGASGIVRFGVTPGDLSPRFGGRGASPKLAG